MLNSIGFIVLALIIAFMIVFFVTKRKQKGKKQDYYKLFWTGVMWFCLGLIPGMWAFSIAGIFFMCVGLYYRKKWNKKKVKVDKNLILTVVTSVVFGLAVAFLVLYLVQNFFLIG